MKFFVIQKNQEPLEIMNSELNFKYLEGFFDTNGRAVIDQIFISIPDKFQDSYDILYEDSVDEIGFVENGEQFKATVKYTYYNEVSDILEVYLNVLSITEENFLV